MSELIDIDLRLTVLPHTNTERPVFQRRDKRRVLTNNVGGTKDVWSEWEDVPVVVVGLKAHDIKEK